MTFSYRRVWREGDGKERYINVFGTDFFVSRCPSCCQPVLKTTSEPHSFFNHQQTLEGRYVAPFYVGSDVSTPKRVYTLQLKFVHVLLVNVSCLLSRITRDRYICTLYCFSWTNSMPLLGWHSISLEIFQQINKPLWIAVFRSSEFPFVWCFLEWLRLDLMFS